MVKKELLKQPPLRDAAMALEFTSGTWNAPMDASDAKFVPRLDCAATLASVLFLLDHHKDEWKDPINDRQWWEQWAETHPTTVEEVEDKPKWEWPSK